MSPRSTRAGAARTRQAIVDRAVEIASVEGLDGLTFGRLSSDVSVSKAGVIGHFATKRDLQEAALTEAFAIFRRDVWDRVAAEEAGLPRLRAIMDTWIAHLLDCPFPGGCFLTAASAEYDARPGPVRDRVRRAQALWRRVLIDDARVAVKAGELPAGTDPELLAFELAAVAAATDQARQLELHDDPGALARRAVARLLGPA